MLNEEISKEILSQAVRAAEKEVIKPITCFVTEHFVKPTSDILVDDLKKVVTAPAKVIRNKIHPEHGKMKVKDLIRKDQGAQTIDIAGAGLGDFKRIANKYGIDFAIVKDKAGDPPKYTVFFKARDVDAITQVLKEYSEKQVKNKQNDVTKKPSILEKLKKFKDIVARAPRKEKEKMKDVVR